MKYSAVYKCHLCGKLISYGEPQEISKEAIPELLGKIVQNQQFADNPYLYKAPMNIPHKCEDGICVGLAYFAGFIGRFGE